MAKEAVMKKLGLNSVGGMLLLACVWGILAVTSGAVQGKPPQGCSFRASVTFDDVCPGGVDCKLRDDGLGAYVDGVNKVLAGTGNGPGFRLDTNRATSTLEGGGDSRCLEIDFADVTTDPSFVSPFAPPNPARQCNPDLGDFCECRGIDLRFSLGDDAVDLCTLQTIGSEDTVGLTVRFAVGLTGAWTPSKVLNYSDSGVGAPVSVTRTGVNPDTWEVVGTTAGLWVNGISTPVYPNLNMPFKMTIQRLP
jgi:hypothetical protein